MEQIMQSLSVHELSIHIEENKENKNILYLDVRTPAEFRAEHIKRFKNISLDKLENYIDELQKYDTVIISCASGNRSNNACKLLKGRLKNLVSLTGGITEWKQAKFPIIQEKTTYISVMRQVQIIVGLGTLAPSLLSLTFSSHYSWISGFFGAGLLVAGLTNTCLLASILAKAPWNQ
jgi:rhodanese-related sulfurtransferase